MGWRVRAHPEVAGDLAAIAAWVGERAGPEAARRRLDEIAETFERLARLPHRGSVRDAIAPGLRAIPAGRRSVVAFVVDDERREVRVIAVAPAGADWAARVAERS